MFVNTVEGCSGGRGSEREIELAAEAIKGSRKEILLSTRFFFFFFGEGLISYLVLYQKYKGKLSTKGQRATTLGIMGHASSVTTTERCHCSTKTTINNM